MTSGARRAALIAAVLFGLPATLLPVTADAAKGRLVYIALDGLGAAEVESWMASGALPHLVDLRANGGYARLLPQPPTSDEALWGTFAIGAGPGYHGLIDFTVPDFTTHEPLRADAEISPPTFWLKMLRKDGPRVIRRRQGMPFWKRLDAGGIPVELLFLPLTFPPDTLEVGRMISGSVPDLRLTRSTFSVLTARELASDRLPMPGGHILQLQNRGEDWVGRIEGPPDPRSDPPRRLGSEVAIRPDQENASAQIRIGGIRRPLRRGEWGGFMPITFEFSPFYKVNGWVRPYYLATNPLSVYFSPVNVDPEVPYLPVAYPQDFAQILSEGVGPFETVGWVEDTFALNAGVLRPKSFLECAHRSLLTRITLVERELERSDWHFLAAAFLAPDRVAHVFPRDGAKGKEQSGEELEGIARRLDEFVGTVRHRLGPDDRLVVFSTHGMASFQRGFNLNTWLAKEGYLVAEGRSGEDSASEPGAGPGFNRVDWSRTRAYGLGNSAIYFNRVGRETGGTVSEEEVGRLAEEISAKLLAVEDKETKTKTKTKPILKMLRGDAVFDGPLAARAPDLLVVYRDGYSTSFGSLLGGQAPDLFTANTTRWIGEHAAADPERIAGFIVSDRPLAVTDPTLADFAATALAYFGVDKPPTMSGRPLFATQ